jgi:hypothetical protein
MNQDSLAKLEQLVQSVREDFNKYSAGNKSASVRVRKAMAEVKKVAQAIRIEVQNSRAAVAETKAPAKKAKA